MWTLLAAAPASPFDVRLRRVIQPHAPVMRSFAMAADGRTLACGGSDGSIELLEPVAASTRLGEPGIRDEALTRDGRFLYAIDADAQRVFGWSVAADGKLEPLGEFEGVPVTVAGLAAS